MIPEDDGQPCTCDCHKGKHLYHMILKPCCPTPVQGGKQKAVFIVEDNLVIASTQEEADKAYQDFCNS